MATFLTKKDMTNEPDVNLEDRVWGSFGGGCGIPTCNCSPGYWISISVGGVLTRIRFEAPELEALARAILQKDHPFDFALFPEVEV